MTDYYAWYASLAREVIATLGREEGIRWINAHKALATRSMRRLQDVWNAEKADYLRERDEPSASVERSE